jgi:hypothetical protein
MAIFAIVQNGIVVNLAESTDALGPGWILSDGSAVIGGTWDGSHFGPDPNAAIEAMEAMKELAKKLLDESDVTVTRCYEHAVAVPSEWQAYRTALRGVISGSQTVLPIKPAYPSGT